MQISTEVRSKLPLLALLTDLKKETKEFSADKYGEQETFSVLLYKKYDENG